MAKLWRPFSAPGAPASLRLRASAGLVVTDDRNIEYLDCASGLWNMALGGAHDAVTGAIARTLSQLGYATLFDTSHDYAEQLAEALLDRCAMPGGAVYLSTTGSSAVETALRLACLYQERSGRAGKRAIVSFDDSYHGGSWLAALAGGLLQAELAPSEQLAPSLFRRIPGPRDEAASLAALAALLAADGAALAAMIVEPVLGSAGVIVPSAAYWAAVQQLCRQHDVVLIADEVATGAGRCGTFLASQALGLQPDIVTLSKGLNAGYLPLGATVLGAPLAAVFRGAVPAVAMGSTQDGNPLGCSAALATQQFIDQHDVLAGVLRKGQVIRTALAGRAYPCVAEVRGLGLMIGIALRHAGGQPFTAAESQQVRAELKENGLLVYHFDGGISLFPALTISEHEIDDMLDLLDTVLCRLF
ncbi:hypothetical protein ASF61_14185 [Duganella sp. Leaf126]|uniref:aminotransferase family protein n=1 Tax=Duganella sp. Leaf126 TaxID=1736266 RepID=UPI0006FC753D|nr:aspartate aminotransferase family protein [Duganella sp. Leaf126]KQQ32685.1 hypothetical protein ASF61_14185 [Duganella sp. Leaf126]